MYKKKSGSVCAAAIKRIITVAGIACVAAGGSLVAQAGEFVEVNVYFQGSCPKYVDNWDVVVGKTPPQRVRWTAWNLDGSARNKTVDYDIVFDPFVGPHPVSKNQGIVESQPVSQKTPAGAMFKYTIDANGCAALDPFIRIQ